MDVTENGKDDITPELGDEIEEGHSGCMCALCDNEVLDSEPFTTVCAHGNRFLVHAFCLEDLTLGDQDEEPSLEAAARGQS